MSLLAGKIGIVFGVANKRSIAWAIAQAFHREGAKLAFSYAGDSVAKRVIPLAESLGAELVVPCDVRNDEEIARAFLSVNEKWGGLDILVHSVAFAPKDELKGSFLDTTREGFISALEISAYSLIALSRAAAPLMSGRN